MICSHGWQRVFYPRVVTGYLFAHDEEEDFIKQFYNRPFTQTKDQATAILRVKKFNPVNLMFPQLTVKEDVFLDAKNKKVLIKYEMEIQHKY